MTKPKEYVRIDPAALHMVRFAHKGEETHSGWPVPLRLRPAMERTINVRLVF